MVTVLMAVAAVISGAVALINPAGRKINSDCDRTTTEMNSFLTTDEAKLVVGSRVVVAKVHFLPPRFPFPLSPQDQSQRAAGVPG